MTETPEDYPCVGVCTDDPESGYCLGCGRPPAVAPVPVQVGDRSAPQAPGREAPEPEPIAP